MSRTATVLLLAAALTTGACAKKRIAECDAFLQTIEKVGACPKIPEATRKGLVDSAQTMRDSLKMLDEGGGVSDAPADLVSSMRDACKTQNASMQQMYADCLK